VQTKILILGGAVASALRLQHALSVTRFSAGGDCRFFTSRENCQNRGLAMTLVDPACPSPPPKSFILSAEGPLGSSQPLL
jgi:hypothetical protein